MSNATLHSESDTFDESNSTRGRLVAHLRQCSEVAVTTGRLVGFWTAVGLPFLYLPLLVIGLQTTMHALAFLGLLVLNLAALFAGRSYARG
jgi:hypothetical protein